MTTIPDLTPTAPIYELYIADISSFTDAWAIDHHPLPGLIADRSAKLVFASIIAPATSIKGIRATLMVRTNISPASLIPYQPDDPRTTPRHNVSLSLLRDHQRWQTRLPSLQRNHHLIIAAKDVPQSATSDDDDQPTPTTAPPRPIPKPFTSLPTTPMTRPWSSTANSPAAAPHPPSDNGRLTSGSWSKTPMRSGHWTPGASTAGVATWTTTPSKTTSPRW